MVLMLRGLYASWTHHLLHHSSHACPTSNAPGMAALNDHTCWACQACPDYLTAGGRGDDHRHRHDGWYEPYAYLQVDTPVYAGGSRGAARQTRREVPAST